MCFLKVKSTFIPTLHRNYTEICNHNKQCLQRACVMVFSPAVLSLLWIRFPKVLLRNAKNLILSSTQRGFVNQPPPLPHRTPLAVESVDGIISLTLDSYWWLEWTYSGKEFMLGLSFILYTDKNVGVYQTQSHETASTVYIHSTQYSRVDHLHYIPDELH